MKNKEIKSKKEDLTGWENICGDDDYNLWKYKKNFNCLYKLIDNFIYIIYYI